MSVSSLALRKLCWVSPEEAPPPKGWPAGWEFAPGAHAGIGWPPGWPKHLFWTGLRLQALYRSNLLTARVLDEDREDTDALAGEYLVAEAHDDLGLVRMRGSRTAPWSKRAMFHVEQFEAGLWGAQSLLYLERPAGVTVSLFGHNADLKTEAV